MPYINAITIAGKTILVEKYYSSRHKKQGVERSKNHDDTKEGQERVNVRKAIRNLTILMNANFQGGDYHATLTYQKEERPATPEDAKQDRNHFIRKMRKEYQKLGIPFKYIIVTEYGKKGAVHHHMVINKIDTDLILKHWNYGRPTFRPLDQNGEYSELAAYFLKGRAQWKEMGGTGRQYSTSRNLERPITRKSIVKANGYYEKPRERKGYYVKKSSEVMGVHENGYPYFKYILIEDNGRRAP